MLLSLRLALRYVFSNKRESFSNFASLLAIGGLSIGITALMLTASIINGFEEIVSKKLSSFQGFGRITNILGMPINLKDKNFSSIEFEDNNLEPFIQSFCLVRFGNVADGILIEGINKLPKSIKNYNYQKIGFEEIIIGKGISNELGCNVGDLIYLQPFNTKKLNPINKISPFKVKYIFNSGIQEYDKLLGYININDARSLFNFKTDYVSGLIVNNKYDNFLSNISYPYFFESWRDKHSLLFEWINVQRWPAYIMFGLIAFVGLVNVLAAIAMIIIEKSNQIGILLSQGMNKTQLKFTFMIQGSIIGLLGALLGGIISMIIIFAQIKFQILKIPEDIYFMDQIPFSFDIFSFAIILITIFIFCVLSSWWPTKIITNIKPSDVLKYE